MGLLQTHQCYAVVQNLISSVWTGKISGCFPELSLFHYLWLRFLYFWYDTAKETESHRPEVLHIFAMDTDVSDIDKLTLKI